MPRKKNAQKSEPQRLQKVLAHAGIASRRASEALIQEGRVSVNGRVVTELGTKVDPDRDIINVDGRPVSKRAEQFTYIMLNKPRHVLSTAGDERGRKTVLDLVDCPERVYPVGRLDLMSEGLILLTNDGDLTRRLTHPGHQVEKEYHVLVTGHLSGEVLSRWRRGGIVVEGQPVGPAMVEVMKVEGENTWLKIVLREGRKRQIREVAAALGHSVRTLIRVRLGPLHLGSIKPGRWRYLNVREIQRLKQAANR